MTLMKMSHPESGHFFTQVPERRDTWVGYPRTGVSEWIVLTHCTDTRCGCFWCGNVLPLLVLLNLTLGGEQDFLMSQ